MEIPQHIKDEISKYFPIVDRSRFDNDKDYMEDFNNTNYLRTVMQRGYSLSQKEIGDLNNFSLAQTDVIMKLQKEIEELREENRRLKDGLKRITRLGADESSRMRSIAEQIINS